MLSTSMWTNESQHSRHRKRLSRTSMRHGHVRVDLAWCKPDGPAQGLRETRFCSGDIFADANSDFIDVEKQIVRILIDAVRASLL